MMLRVDSAEAMTRAEAEAEVTQSLAAADVAAWRDAATWRDGVIVISKARMELTLFDAAGTAVLTFPVACGKAAGHKRRAGDMRTPEGRFAVQQVQNASSWTHDFRDGKGVIAGAYGGWFIRLATGFSGIGIHGTHAPATIGTRATEGCIRLRNDDLERLKPQVKIGMPVYILPGEADVVANREAATAGTRQLSPRQSTITNNTPKL